MTTETGYESILLSMGLIPMFEIGDFVRLGKDMPFQIKTLDGLINCHKIKGYRIATDAEKKVAKLNQQHKKGKATWGEVLKAWQQITF